MFGPRDIEIAPVFTTLADSNVLLCRLIFTQGFPSILCKIIGVYQVRITVYLRYCKGIAKARTRRTIEYTRACF